MRIALLLLALFAALPARAQDTPGPERVVMKLEDFLKLYEQTRDRPKEPPKPPSSWSVSSARYDGKVIFDHGAPTSAVFDATLRIEVLEQKGWVKVPLLPATVALRSAKLGNQDASVIVDGGWYWLATDRTGTLDLKLSFAVSVFSHEGASGLSFELPKSGGATVSLAVPTSEDLDFEVADARVLQVRTEGGNRIVDASIPVTGSLSVTWQHKLPEATKAQEARVYAEVFSLLGIGDGLLQETATIQNTILFAGVDTLKVAIPDGMTLLDVKGAGIRDWKVTDDTLVVGLNYAAEGAYPLTLQLEKVVGQGDLQTDAPLPTPLGAERVKGYLGVEARGNLEIGAGGAATGATAVDVRNLPAAILGITTQPVLLGYKYLSADAKIPLKVTQHEDVDVLVTLLDHAQATTMWTADGRRMTKVVYQVRNNRKQYLRLALPEGAELWSASLGGRAVQPARSADGKVLLPLVRSQAQGGALAAFAVEVVYVEQGTAPDAGGRGTFTAQLPTADVPTTYVAWQVWAPEGAKIGKRSIEGSLRHVEAFSNPVPMTDMAEMPAMDVATVQTAQSQANTGALGQGAAPVPVSLPLTGAPIYFEKLLALEEPLKVQFAYHGLKNR